MIVKVQDNIDFQNSMKTMIQDMTDKNIYDFFNWWIEIVKWIILIVSYSSETWHQNLTSESSFLTHTYTRVLDVWSSVIMMWKYFPTIPNSKSSFWLEKYNLIMIVNKTQNQFKIRLTGLTERAQKMNELEEWETIYKEKYLIELHIFIFFIRYVFCSS